jgi:hypothetical protein
LKYPLLVSRLAKVTGKSNWGKDSHIVVVHVNIIFLLADKVGAGVAGFEDSLQAMAWQVGD